MLQHSTFTTVFSRPIISLKKNEENGGHYNYAAETLTSQ